METIENITFFITEADGTEHPAKTKQEAQAALDDGKHVVQEKFISTYTTNTDLKIFFSTHYKVGETIE